MTRTVPLTDSEAPGPGWPRHASHGVGARRSGRRQGASALSGAAAATVHAVTAAAAAAGCAATATSLRALFKAVYRSITDSVGRGVSSPGEFLSLDPAARAWAQPGGPVSPGPAIISSVMIGREPWPAA